MSDVPCRMFILSNLLMERGGIIIQQPEYKHNGNQYFDLISSIIIEQTGLVTSDWILHTVTQALSTYFN